MLYHRFCKNEGLGGFEGLPAILLFLNSFPNLQKIILLHTTPLHSPLHPLQREGLDVTPISDENKFFTACS